MEIELKAETRKEIGNKVKTLREKGFIPAVVYGSGHKPISIQIDYREFEKVFEEAGESTIIKLKVKSQKSKINEKNVLIHEIDRNPETDKFVHVDFLQVRMDKLITAMVHLVFEGESSAVKNLEGVLIKSITEVEVEALPKDLPHELKVDISALETFDDHIKIGDLKLSEGVKIKIEPEEVIASVTPPRTKEELETLEEKPEAVIPVEGDEEAEAPTPAEGEAGVPTPDEDQDVGKESTKETEKTEKTESK